MPGVTEEQITAAKQILNPISAVGLDQLDENYVNVETAKGADAILVRSAKMHEMEFDKNLKVIARAGAGVNNIPLERCAEEGVVEGRKDKICVA